MAKTELKAKPPKRAIWSGSISIGLINIPIKLYPMIYDKSFSFRLLHKEDGYPIRYEKVCSRDGVVIEAEDVVKGYEVRKGEFIMFNKEELKALEPQSDKIIHLDKFVPFSAIDPIYLEKSYILTPDKNKEAYSLLFTVMKTKGIAGIGKFALRNKEYPVLIHEYKGALLLTTLRYAYEIVDPHDIEELSDLKEPDKKELELAIKIVENLSGEFDINEYRDNFTERVEALIEKKMKGETIVIEKPKKEEVKGLMVALQETLKKLEKKNETL